MRSLQFDDIYFSLEDGLAETAHTFLGGNDLPQAWVGRKRFCICETGFGTGLNILAAWRLFEGTAKSDQRLDLISIEKYPLNKDEIRAALTPWDLQPQLDILLAQYPMRVRGFHRLNLTPRVTLTLIFDDVLQALPQMQANVDAWFLDGFAPAKNPDMWTPALFAQMARLSHDSTSVATFTAAGEVRRGLQASGFTIEKKPGYGRKRDMTVGRFHCIARATESAIKRVAIAGAGLAGISAAWHLQREGMDVIVYDAGGVAAGASGNSIGLINPKLTAQPSAQSAYYTSAYNYALRSLDHTPCGSLHVQSDDDKARRFKGYLENLGWHNEHMQLVDADAASAIAGVNLNAPCLYYPDAATASPRAVCAALAQNIAITKENMIDVNSADADAIVLANAAAVGDFCDLPISSVRGQVSRLTSNAVSAKIKTNLCYGGYITPVTQGAHVCGATFQPWDTDVGVRAEDHARNIQMLNDAIPGLGDLPVQGGWTGFRAATRDRFPVVGAYGDVYVSAGHGSHGLTSAWLAGAVLAAQLAGGPLPVPAEAVKTLNPLRFKG